MAEDNTPKVSLRMFLCAKVMMAEHARHVTFFEATEAVASTALAHEEWPALDEERTWAEWAKWSKANV